MTHASICSGIDGPALAAFRLGWDNVFHADINEFTNRILKYYYPHAKHYTDIRNTDFSEWRGRIDVLSAGFPCQPFSVAGKRTGADHDSYLWPETLRVVGEVRPRWFVGENVNGIASVVFPGAEIKVGKQADLFGKTCDIYERTDRYVIDRICCDLEAIGYEVVPVIIPACAVGAPHERMRCFFLCHNTQDAVCDGWQNWERETEFYTGQYRNSGTADNGRIPPDNKQVVADGADAGSEDMQESQVCSDSARYASDPDSERCGEYEFPGESEEERFGRLFGDEGITDWAGFPTQSLVCSRDDGFPGEISGITVSCWRRESIQALGNAIVPQVALKIFETIEKIENR